MQDPLGVSMFVGNSPLWVPHDAQTPWPLGPDEELESLLWTTLVLAQVPGLRIFLLFVWLVAATLAMAKL